MNTEATKALDWFDFETRMRKIIHEIMEPTVKRSHEDREMVTQLKSVVVDHDKRLKPMEFALYKSEEPTDAFEKIHAKMLEIEQKRLEDQTKLHHQMTNLKDFVESFNLKFDKAASERKQLKSFIDANVQNIKDLQEQVNEKHKQNQEERVKMMEQITREMNKLRERTNTLDLQAANNKIHVDTCKVTVEQLEVQASRVQDNLESVRAEIDSLRRGKLERHVFDKKHSKINEEIKVVRVVLENTLNEFKSIENYASKYLPIKLQTQITEMLRLVLSRKDKKKIDNYNKEKLAIYHHAIIEDDGIGSIDIQISKLQESMKMVDSRFKFPKVDKTEVDKTMSIVNNVSEILENKRQHKKLYTYRDGNILRAEEPQQKPNEGQESGEFAAENIIPEDLNNEEIQVYKNSQDFDSKSPKIVTKQQKIEHQNLSHIENETDEEKKIEERMEKDTEKELEPRPFTKQDFQPQEESIIVQEEINPKLNGLPKPNSPLERLNQSSISEIKENYSVPQYSEDSSDNEKDSQNMLLQEHHRDQFDELTKYAQELIAEKITEHFKIYDIEVDNKLARTLASVNKDVKECNEYISTLHNEIDQSSSNVKVELSPIIKDMNKLHSLMIQTNDDNRMIFSNLRTVTLFIINIFDLVVLISEMNKVAELGPTLQTKSQTVSTMARELGIISDSAKELKNSLNAKKEGNLKGSKKDLFDIEGIKY